MIQRLIVLLCTTLAVLQMHTLMAAEVGDAAPNCVFTSNSNTPPDELHSLRGQVVYIDFWASWCGPCAKSFPFLNTLDQDFRDSGLKIIGVNMDEKTEDMTTFLNQSPADFMLAVPPNDHCAVAFGVKAMPSSYIIDRTGRIRLVHLGFRDGEAQEIRTLIQQLLAERPSGQ